MTAASSLPPAAGPAAADRFIFLFGDGRIRRRDADGEPVEWWDGGDEPLGRLAGLFGVGADDFEPGDG